MSSLRFLHSGKYGDLIYALWTIKKLGGGEIWFNLTKGSLCDEENYRFCKPLFEKQFYISGVKTITLSDNLSNPYGEKLFCRQDINNPDFLILDNAWFWRFFRARTDTYHWINRYAYTFGVVVDASEVVLDVKCEPIPWNERHVVVHLTDRYRIKTDEFYKDLLKRDDVIRIGDLPGEKRCSDMLELATLIASSKFFVGNYSCGNALAQALQHPRLIEVERDYGDAYPIGGSFAEAGDNIQNDITKITDISKEYWRTV